MAVSPMKKLSVIAPRKEADKLIAELQRMSCVEISRVPFKEETRLINQGQPAKLHAEIEADLSVTKHAIEFLMKYDRGKNSLSVLPPDIQMSDFDAGLDIVALETVHRANGLCDMITKLKSEILDIEAEIEALEPWQNEKVEIPEYKTFRSISVGGTMPGNTDLAVVEEKLSQFACVLCVVSSDKFTKTVYVTSHRDDYDEVRRVLSAHGFTKCTTPATVANGYAVGAINARRESIKQKKHKLSSLNKEARDLSVSLPSIKAFYDVLETRRERLYAKELTACTEKTIIVCGWVPEKAEKLVSDFFILHEYAYSFEEPDEDDDVPVLLSNNRLAANFEPVLTMFAYPKYGTFDPTMIMSIFYFIIFGLMFADFGYGLILLIGSIAAIKIMKPKAYMKHFLTMFAICSVSCMIGGVLFGGYFGDLPVALLENFGGRENVASPALLFDMIEEPMLFLVLSLGVGAVHLLSAMIIKFCILIHDGHIFDAIADVGSWLLVFSGIGVYFASSTVGIAMIGIGVVMLVATQGRNEKNIFLRIGKGLYSLYDIVSYASDLLSYSRILALSLASAVIASVVNLLATMGGLTIPGIILFIFVFLLGHTINFAVNILGTYVHTSRLQYIEFFGKFFESGGRKFAPLAHKTKYVNLK